MQFDVRALEAGNTREIYVTAGSRDYAPAQQQAEEMYSRVVDVVRSANARIMCERIFATQDAIGLALPIRRKIYGDLDDGFEPVCLTVPKGVTGEISGVQVHAVVSENAPELLRVGGSIRGRTLEIDGYKFVMLAGLTAADAGSAPDQAWTMFKSAEAALKHIGADMFSVARTWLWLGNILDWYDQFNEVRTTFFTECGLLNGNPAHGRMPASTGIGVMPASEPVCALDAFAVAGRPDAIRFFTQTGKQDSAFKYGSAFSRAARSVSPAGETVFVSGTASIAPSGDTIHVDDIPGQIEETFRCVRSVIKQTECSEDEVVQSIIYCKTPEVEEVFREMYGDLEWPHLIMISDVCREDLLFEIEATAAVGAKKIC